MLMKILVRWILPQSITIFNSDLRHLCVPLLLVVSLSWAWERTTDVSTQPICWVAKKLKLSMVLPSSQTAGSSSGSSQNSVSSILWLEGSIALGYY
jgi:hypothetical protein